MNDEDMLAQKAFEHNVCHTFGGVRQDTHKTNKQSDVASWKMRKRVRWMGWQRGGILPTNAEKRSAA